MSHRIEQLADGVTLHLGDCRELLPKLGGVDVIISDPPYAEKTHAGARTGDGSEILVDFASLTDADFKDCCEAMLKCAARWVVMTCDWQHAADLQRERPAEFIRAGVWIKPNGMPQYTGDRPAMGWEAVAILHRPGRKRWNGGGSHAVWNVPKVHGNHPTEKPLALVSEWVRLFSEPGEVICDPFCGSGTTGVAAVRDGRSFVGCELSEKYFDVACRRIADELRRPRLFAPQYVKPVQEALL